MPDSPSLPLADVRVLDLTQLLPGPMCTLYLADLGAEVIKLEPPGSGDAARGAPGQTSMLFEMVNRNKRSLCVDLRNDDDIAFVHELIPTADILVEGFRPGVITRLGLNVETLQQLNPRLVICSITGYGQTGDMSQAAGHDINYQALAGVLDQSGAAGGPPAQGNLPMADLAGGALSAATGILAALFDAQRSGRGRHVDIAMTDCLMALNVNATASWLQADGKAPVRGADYISGALPCYDVYETQDGRYLAVGALEMKFWRICCEVLGCPDLHDKGHRPGRVGQETRRRVAEIIASRTQSEWVEAFRGQDACVTPVLSVGEAVDRSRNKAVPLTRETMPRDGKRIIAYRCPIRMTDIPEEQWKAAPDLGADNADLRAELDRQTANI